MHVYKVRPHNDKRGVDLISDGPAYCARAIQTEQEEEPSWQVIVLAASR